MKTKHSLSDLIAFRDSQPMDPASRAAIVADPNAKLDLAELAELQDKLASLSDQAPDDDLWEHILLRTTAPRSPKRGQSKQRSFYPLRIAASVFAMAAALVLFLQPDYMPNTPQMAEAVVVGDLQARSQSLQQRLGGYNMPTNADYQNIARAAYMYNVADVDQRINQLAEADLYNAPRAQELWEERVDVLENWLAMERVDRLQQTAY